MSSSHSGGKSDSSSQSMNSYFQKDSVFKPQKKYLQDLYSEAQRQYQNFNPHQYDDQFAALGEQLKGINANTDESWKQMLKGGAQSADLDAAIKASMNSPSEMGKMYESITGGPGNTYIDPMVQAMKAGQIDNMKQQLATVNLDAVGAGQAGSSRHGVSEALTRALANNQMLDKEATMRGENYDRDMQWKMGIAQQADTNRGAAQDRAAQLLAQKNQMMQYGINANQQMQKNAGSLLDNAMRQGNLSWDNYNKYKSGIGAPLILGSSGGSGSSSGSSSSKNASSSASMKS